MRYFLLLFFLLHTTVLPLQEAFVCVPIADVSGEPGTERIHQLLFNERVTIVEEQENFVKILFTGTFYQVPTIQEPQISYWSDKKNFRTKNSVEQETGISIDQYVPPALDFRTSSLPENKKIITLKMPWHDTKTKSSYSVGTQFVYQAYDKKKDHFHCLIYHPTSKTIKPATIAGCQVQVKKINTQAIDHFVALLRSWTTHQPSISYVLGGCSFTGKAHESIGFDCSGAILRAAQIVGLPYFCKNSYTALRCLTPVSPHELPRNGDIIWLPGHLMVVSDIDRNVLIEARGHKDGFGKLHEIPLEKTFAGVKTYQDMMNIIKQNKKVSRLCVNGNATAHVHLKVLRIQTNYASEQ